jgi:hypothetical protein
LTGDDRLAKQDTGRRGAETHRIGRIWIRRTGSAYDVMLAPTGNGEFRIATAAGLRALLWEATIPAERIDETLDALRHDTEHEILDVTLTLDLMSKLGL